MVTSPPPRPLDAPDGSPDGVGDDRAFLGGVGRARGGGLGLGDRARRHAAVDDEARQDHEHRAPGACAVVAAGKP